LASEKVLVTGAGGFFGGHIARRLGGDCITPRSSELNLLDSSAVEAYLRTHSPRAVVHAAGFVGGIGLNKQHPGRMALDNLKMGLNILEAAAKLGDIHVVLISTICVYPADAAIPMREDGIYEGYPAQDTAAYGLAKRELLSLAQALRAEFNLKFSYVIPTNLYGPEDHFDPSKSHVVPALIERIHQAKASNTPSIEVWGDGTATRDLLYAEDAAEAIALILKQGPFPEPINIGSGRETSVRELVETIRDLMEYKGDIEWNTGRPAGAARRLLDITRAQNRFGFAPQTRLKDGLKQSIDWYESNISQEKQ
jgi:GDP-L-fucose synthase